MGHVRLWVGYVMLSHEASGEFRVVSVLSHSTRSLSRTRRALAAKALATVGKGWEAIDVVIHEADPAILAKAGYVKAGNRVMAAVLGLPADN